MTPLYVNFASSQKALAITPTSTWSTIENISSSIEAINDLYCINSTFCIGVGYTPSSKGVVFTSIDSGSHWTLQNTPNSITDLQQITCLNQTDCVAVGQSAQTGTVIYSQNSGATWNSATVPSGFNSIKAISCSSSSFCLAIGYKGIFTSVLVSSDSGQIWTNAPALSSDYSMQSVVCISTFDCLMVGNDLSDHGTILVTSNSGASWSLASIPNSVSNIYSVDCQTVSVCTAVGDFFNLATGLNVSVILNTDNFGSSWTLESSPSSVNLLDSISCVGVEICLAVGLSNNNPVSLSSINGGTSWAQSTLTGNIAELNSIFCVTTTFCITGGYAGTQTNPVASLNLTENLGATWLNLKLPDGISSMNDISCDGIGFCLAVGNSYSPIAEYSNNYGATWNVTTMPFYGDYLTSVNCPTESFCIAAGYSYIAATSTFSGIVVVSTNGGVSWTSAIVPLTIGILKDIYCQNINFCVAVGDTNNGSNTIDSGAVIVSTNQGLNWTQENVPTGTTSLHAITCPNSTSCLAAGQYTNSYDGHQFAVTLASTNSGVTWSINQSIGSASVLNKVSCSSISYCIAVGDLLNRSNSTTTGSILFSNNFGISWTDSTPTTGNGSEYNSVMCILANCFVGGKSSSQTAALLQGNAAAGWQSANIPTGLTELTSLSCATSTFCFSLATSDSALISNQILEYSTPVISQISPSAGNVSGQTVLDIAGYGFSGIISVQFGNISAITFKVVNSGEIKAVSPASLSPGTINITVTNANGPSNPEPFNYTEAISYIPISATRICDTRPYGANSIPANQCNDGVSHSGSLSSNSILNITVIGSFSSNLGLITVPATATSVVLNITATDTTALGGYLSVYPTGFIKPNSSTLNFGPNYTVANLTQVGVGANGQVSIYNFVGNADVVVDLEGYYLPTNSMTGNGQFIPINPVRVCDSRGANGVNIFPNQCDNNSTISNPITGNSSAIVNIGGNGPGGNLDGIPANATAVSLNLTATDTTSNGGFFTVYPTASALPNSSNLNFGDNDTVANTVIVPLSTSGDISLYSYNGKSDYVIDVTGYYTKGGTAVGGSDFSPIYPTRICDSRPVNPPYTFQNHCNILPTSTLSTQSITTVNVAGSGPGGSQDLIPPGAKAVVLNITVTNTAGDGGFLTAYPSPPTSGSVPNTSNLNWSTGQTLANSVIVKIGVNGSINLFNFTGSADIIIDVIGYYR